MSQATKQPPHCIMRNSNIFCTNCGREQIVPYPIQPYMFSAMVDAFEEEHKNCEKTWVEPTAPNGLPEGKAMEWWMEKGEHGISSKTMFCVLGGVVIMSISNYHTPSDPDDFKRCHLLLEAVPTFRTKLDKMKSVSPVWEKLVDNWDKLTDMLKEQMETKKANGMYEFMKSLGC